MVAAESHNCVKGEILFNGWWAVLKTFDWLINWLILKKLELILSVSRTCSSGVTYKIVVLVLSFDSFSEILDSHLSPSDVFSLKSITQVFFSKELLNLYFSMKSLNLTIVTEKYFQTETSDKLSTVQPVSMWKYQLKFGEMFI